MKFSNRSAARSGVGSPVGALLALASARPGDASQRARVLAHYDEMGAGYGSRDRSGGVIDRLWSRWVRPREVRYVMAAIDAGTRERILDVGCGSGTYARVLAAMGNTVVATDASPSMVEAVRADVASAVLADIETLALNEVFDRVICLGVLDFVADPARCLERLAAHVKEGGWLVVLAPRRGFTGLYYRVAKLLAGIRVNSFDVHALDQAVRPYGLTREAYCSPLPNSIAVRWRKA